MKMTKKASTPHVFLVFLERDLPSVDGGVTVLRHYLGGCINYLQVTSFDLKIFLGAVYLLSLDFSNQD